MSDHHHHSFAGKNKKNLKIVFILTFCFMIVEAIGGYLTNSLALFADAAHMFTDTGALGLALIAIWFAEKPATADKTYGYYRTEIVAAFINALILLIISFFILYEAWQRLNHPPEVLSKPMFVIAALGLIVNLIGMKLLSEGSSNSLNIKGAYLEVFSDMLGSIGVIIASLLIMFKGWEIADPIASIAMGLFILPRTWHLLKQVVHVLLEGTPTHIDIDKVEKELSSVEGVIAVHDIHIWTITSGIDVMTAHVEIADFADGNGILIDIKKVLVSKFNILHSTIQLETDECKESDLINI